MQTIIIESELHKFEERVQLVLNRGFFVSGLEVTKDYQWAILERDTEGTQSSFQENDDSTVLTCEVSNSTVIEMINYDTSEGCLIITFSDGDIYQYTNVPIEIYVGLVESESKGEYFNKHIKFKFYGVKL